MTPTIFNAKIKLKNTLNSCWKFFIYVFLITFTNISFAVVNYEKVEVELLTISPGEYYWEAFGHSAIRIKSPGFDKSFGFGYFNFADDDFFVNFAKGEMQYFLGVVDSDLEFDEYVQQNRKIVIQKLNLTTQEKQQLVESLIELSLPVNRHYQYDYFLNNCTSKIRDILNEVTHGKISNHLLAKHSYKSWSDLTFPVANQSWMNLGIAMAYGVGAYSTKDQWHLSVFPEVFSRDIQELESQGSLLADYEIYFEPKKDNTNSSFLQFFNTHYALLLSVIVVLLGLLLKLSQKSTQIFWLVLQSLLGLVLLLLWLMTKHSIAHWNINVLLFNPLAFLLLFKSLRKKSVIVLFLACNLLWLVLALFYTHLYLTGFLIVNLIIGNRLFRT